MNLLEIPTFFRMSYTVGTTLRHPLTYFYHVIRYHFPMYILMMRYGPEVPPREDSVPSEECHVESFGSSQEPLRRPSIPRPYVWGRRSGMRNDQMRGTEDNDTGSPWTLFTFSVGFSGLDH